MPEPRKFPSVDIRQKRFLRTLKKFDLAPNPVVDIVLEVVDAV